MFRLISSIVLFLSISIALGQSYEIRNGSITDSYGRTMKFRYGVPIGYNTAEPAGLLVYLHGNATGTQDDMLDGYFGYPMRYAGQYNLLPVVLASPETYDGSTRAWNYEADTQLLYDLLQQNLDAYITVDTSRVFLWGGSQGTCFINAFLTLIGDAFGGGSYAQCGCLDYYNNNRQLDQNFQDNYRIFVQANTGDFLWEPSVQAYEYYRFTHGVQNVRADLGRAGEHCENFESLNDSVWQWLAGEEEIFPESAFEEHWERLNVFPGFITTATIDLDNSILAAAIDNSGLSSLYRSVNQGESWVRIAQLSAQDTIVDMEVTNDGTTWLVCSNGIWQSTDGINYTLSNSLVSENIWSDGNDLWVMGWNTGLHQYDKNTSSWVNMNYYSGGLQGAWSNFARLEPTQRTLMFDSWTNGQFRVYYGDATGTTQEITLPLTHNIIFADRRDNLAVIFGQFADGQARLLISSNGGQSWLDKTSLSPYDDIYQGMSVVILPSGTIFLHGGANSWYSDDLGQTWERVINFRHMEYPVIIEDLDGVQYAASGMGWYMRKTWATESARPEHTDPTSVVVNTTTIANTITSELNGNILEINAHADWKLKVFTSEGNNIYSDQGRGNTRYKLPELSSGVYTITLSRQTRKENWLWNNKGQ